MEKEEGSSKPKVESSKGSRHFVLTPTGVVNVLTPEPSPYTMNPMICQSVNRTFSSGQIVLAGSSVSLREFFYMGTEFLLWTVE